MILYAENELQLKMPAAFRLIRRAENHKAPRRILRRVLFYFAAGANGFMARTYKNKGLRKHVNSDV